MKPAMAGLFPPYGRPVADLIGKSLKNRIIYAISFLQFRFWRTKGELGLIFFSFPPISSVKVSNSFF